MIKMNHRKLPGDSYQVEYHDESGKILFEETVSKSEMDHRSKLTILPEDKFLKALADPKVRHTKGFE